MDVSELMESVSFSSRLFKQSFYWISAKNKEEIEKLVEELQTISKVTWSIEKTIQKENVRNNLFNRIYYCHFNTRRRKNTKDLKKKSSRNINCPAKLILTLKKIIPMSKSKANNSLNKVDKEYPCLLEFRNNHNHRSDV
ncbi:unnamed protein product [Psylliodes chrysocephalus]|uniref:Uncharacterized protein n=1 Tax=Psylliodes chrysocephalus TaxID=3402493 RepID=A0A9P0DF45_9CUCU|nr:unnamed protein product [Psylliodes chrysocephala]